MVMAGAGCLADRKETLDGALSMLSLAELGLDKTLAISFCCLLRTHPGKLVPPWELRQSPVLPGSVKLLPWGPRTWSCLLFLLARLASLTSQR